MSNIFITGSTGFLGSCFIARLLQETDSYIFLLARSEKKVVELKSELNPVHLDRMHFIYGDVTKQGMDLPSKVSSFIKQNVEEIWHIAATTDLNVSREASEKTNIEGTRNIIDFARGVPHLNRYFHVSTAYVCGHKPDRLVYETITSRPAAHYKTTYEETKHKAEILLSESHLPWIILRPSIIVGDSKTGIAKSTRMIYGFLKSYHIVKKMIHKEMERNGKTLDQMGQVRMEAPENATQNLICVDDVVNLMMHVRNKGPKPHSVYHLVNPVNSNNRDVHESICAVLDTPFICLVPDITDEKISIEERLLRRSTRVYKAHLAENDPVFDTTEIRNLIGEDYRCSVPDRRLLDFLFREYYERELCEKPGFFDSQYDSFEKRNEALQKYMTNSISYFTTGDMYKAFSIQGVEGYLPYIQVDRTAVIIGDPLTAERDYEAILNEFIAQMNAERVSVSALQISSAFAEAFEKRQYFVNCMGIETFIDIGSFSLSGNRMKKLRQNITTAERYGVTVMENEYDSMDMEKVGKISARWMSKKENTHELAVITRPLNNSKETEVRRFVAYVNEEMVGYVFFNPIFESSNIIGYLSDIERYLRHPPGVHDYILYKAIRSFTQEGSIQFLSLGMSPFEDIELHERKTYSAKTQSIIKSIRNEENPVYSFKNVSKHKKLFNGIEKPLYYTSSKSDVRDEIVNMFHAIGILTPKSLLETSDDLFFQFV